MEEIIEPMTEPKNEIRKPKKQHPSKAPGESEENAFIWHLVLLRNTRNSYLSLTDKYLLPDYPITDEKKEIIINYRQYLRDLININKLAILNGAEIEILPIPI